MIAYNGYLDDDDATKEAGADFARRGDIIAPRATRMMMRMSPTFFERRD